MITFMIDTTITLMFVLLVMSLLGAIFCIMDLALFSNQLGRQIQSWCKRKVGIAE